MREPFLRIADRDFAETESCAVDDFFRDFTEPGTWCNSRTETAEDRHRSGPPARKVGCDSDGGQVGSATLSGYGFLHKTRFIISRGTYMQIDELSYAIITPYSMRKSRTGGIIARLISRTGLDLVAARTFAPSDELIRRYAETIVSETEPTHRAAQELIRAYVSKNFTGEKNGQAARVLFLVFRGTGAVD